MFLKPENLGFAADNPVVMYNGGARCDVITAAQLQTLSIGEPPIHRRLKVTDTAAVAADV